MSASVLRALERFVLPNACVVCERQVSEAAPDELVCHLCRARLESIVGGCSRCAQPLPPIGPCRFCAAWPTAFRWVRSAVWLSDEAKEIVHHLKYEGYRTLAQAVADVIERRVLRPGHGVLVPVPLGVRRLRTRGYNQAGEIARALAARWSLPLLEGLVRRTRDTKSQTALAPDARERNVHQAFAATRPERAGESEAQVILIDDVLTTGATLAAAARALESAGWSNVAAVTFARAVPFELRAV
jgi:ComF family protein